VINPIYLCHSFLTLRMHVSRSRANRGIIQLPAVPPILSPICLLSPLTCHKVGETFLMSYCLYENILQFETSSNSGCLSIPRNHSSMRICPTRPRCLLESQNFCLGRKAILFPVYYMLRTCPIRQNMKLCPTLGVIPALQVQSIVRGKERR